MLLRPRFRRGRTTLQATVTGTEVPVGRKGSAPVPPPLPPVPPPVPPAAPAASAASDGDALIAQLQQLAELKSQGALTEEEFAAAKAKILGG